MLRSLRHYQREQNQGHDTIDRLEGSAVTHKNESMDDFPWRTRKGHRQSVPHWSGFKGNTGNTFKTRGGPNMGFPDGIDLYRFEENSAGLVFVRFPALVAGSIASF